MSVTGFLSSYVSMKAAPCEIDPVLYCHHADTCVVVPAKQKRLGGPEGRLRRITSVEEERGHFLE